MTRSRGPRLGLTLVLLAVITISACPGQVAASAPEDKVIVLPGATSAEGIAVGRGSTFFAGDLFTGNIFRGDLQRGTAELFIDVPDSRMAVGLKADVANSLLFVAGGQAGNAYVYDTRTRETVDTVELANTSTPTFINDVVITREGAWFTDSLQPKLYLIPIGPGGELGTVRTLQLSGPAADTSGEFNLNGIAATANGSTLIVSHTGTGRLYTVNPATGASAVIDGVTLPDVDGILLEAGRLWAVQNFSNQISVIRLSSDLTSGAVEQVITDSAFQVPTTVARFGGRLVVVNAKFDTGFPPTASQFEVVVVDR